MYVTGGIVTENIPSNEISSDIFKISRVVGHTICPYCKRVNNLKILDCTFRDGGYYTQWDFNSEVVDSYCHLIAKLPIEYIEIGYKSNEKDLYFGEFYYTPLATIKRIKEKIGKSQKIALMLDAKDCETIDISRILSTAVGNVDLIRIATDPNKIGHSLDIAKSVKKHGLKVALNIMYISELDEEHSFYKNIADIDQYVDFLYLVDSYGSIYPSELEKMINIFRDKTNIALGFHGHNNLELAFSNTLKAMECGVEIIDSTVLGMGRGAGNLKLELLLIHLKAKNDLSIDLDIVSQLVDLFTPLKKEYQWGTNFPYMVSGSYSLPQKNVMDAIEINRYSIASIVSIMTSKNVNKLPEFPSNIRINKCLIIGGGASVMKDISAIAAYLRKEELITIIHSTSKYITEFSNLKNKQFFCIAGDELTKLKGNVEHDHIDMFIFEPSPRTIDVKIPKQITMFELKSISFIEKFHDSPLCISIQTSIDMCVEEIELIGFDGYTEIKSKKEFYLLHENQEIISSISNLQLNICSLTKTNYQGLMQRSIYSKID